MHSWSEHKYSNCCCDHDWQQTFSHGHTRRIGYECPLNALQTNRTREAREDTEWAAERDEYRTWSLPSPAWCWETERLHVSQMQHQIGLIDESHYIKKNPPFKAFVILRSFKHLVSNMFHIQWAVTTSHQIWNSLLHSGFDDKCRNILILQTLCGLLRRLQRTQKLQKKDNDFNLNWNKNH